MVQAQTAMELRLLSRRGENLLVTLGIPVGLLLFFGSVRALPGLGDRPVDFLLPGILALAVISTSFVNLGIATAFERGSGVLKRLGGTPLPRSGLVAAKLAGIIVVEAIQVVLLIAIAVVVFGWQPGAGSNLAVAVLALLFGTGAFAGLGLVLAGSLRPEATLAVANGVYLLLLLIGGIVIPLDQIPGPLAALSRALPASALADALRIGLGAAPGDAMQPLLVLLAWGVVSVAIASRTFRWE
jgi:ABC-2 type transport system permease protein